MLVSPPFVDLWYTQTSLLARADQQEHCLQCAVAAVALASSDCLGYRHPHPTGVPAPKHIRALHHEHGGVIGVVGMNEGVHQCFA